MARQRRVDEGLNALDLELARLLDVEAPADFAARVRQRVQLEPPRRGWGFVWTFAPVAALVVMAVGLTFVMRTSSPETEPIAVRRAPVSDVPLAMHPPDAATAPEQMRANSRSDPAPPTARRSEASQAPSLRTEAIVIVDERQRAGLELMMQLVRDGRLDSSMLATPQPLALPLEADVEVAPLTVRPLEIAPIPGARTDYR